MELAEGRPGTRLCRRRRKGNGGRGKSIFHCLPGTEEGSVKLVNHVAATELVLGQLRAEQSRLLEPHKLTEPRAVVWQGGDRAEQGW